MTALPGTKARKRIYLMRHGHVDYFRDAVRMGGADFVHLTEQGHAEARAAGEALSHIPFDRAVISGLPRTRLTAEEVLAVQEAPAPELEQEPRLKEIGGGRPLRLDSRAEMAATIARAFDQAAEPGAAIGEEGETFEAAYARSTAAVTELLAARDWVRMLIVAHEGINRILLSWACGAHLNAAGAFEQDTGCINVLDADMGQDGRVERMLVKSVNLTPYDYTKHGMNRTSLEAIFAVE